MPGGGTPLYGSIVSRKSRPVGAEVPGFNDCAPLRKLEVVHGADGSRFETVMDVETEHEGEETPDVPTEGKPTAATWDL